MANTKIPSELIADSAITATHLSDGTISPADIAVNAITTAKIADSNITTAKLNDDAVTTAKITDANVTTAKIADDAVTTAKMADNSVTSDTIASGITLAGTTTLTSHLVMGDNDYIKLGDSSDFLLTHDGSNSYIIDNGTGNLVVAANAIYLKNAAYNEQMISAIENGAVELYYDNSKKLETVTGGVKVTGALSITGDGSNAVTFTETGAGLMTIAAADDFVIDAGSDIILDADGGDIRFKDGGTEIGVFENSSSDFQIKASVQDKDIIFRGNDGGSGINALVLDMSAAGAATFNNNVTAANHIATTSVYSNNGVFYGATTLDLKDSSAASFVSFASDKKATFAGDLQATGVYVGSTNTSYDLYNNGTTYLNGATIVDDNLTSNKYIMTGGSQIGQDYTYLKGTSTSTASLTLRKDASGADSIDFLQLRNNANSLIGKITGPGVAHFTGAEITGTTNITGGLNVNGAHINIDAGMSFQWGDSHERIEQSDGHLEFFVNNGQKMTLDTNGLGIGTDTPTSALHVSNGSITAGTASETGGTLILQNYYSGDHHLANIGTNHSSGGLYFSYGVKQEGSGTTQSTFSNFSGKRSFVQLFGDRMAYSFAAAQDTAIGTGVSGLSEKVRISEYGVAFNGDTAAANSLDDYEEGDHTTTITCASGSIALYSNYDTISYTKVGRKVHVQGKLAVNTVSSPTGATTISLPFAVAQQNDRGEDSTHVGVGYFNGSAIDTGFHTVYMEVIAGVSYVRPYVMRPNTTAGNAPTTHNLGDNFMAQGSDIYLNFTYLTT